MCSLTLRKFLLRAKIFPSVEKTIEGKILNLTSLRHHHKKGSTSHTAQMLPPEMLIGREA